MLGRRHTGTSEGGRGPPQGRVSWGHLCPRDKEQGTGWDRAWTKLHWEQVSRSFRLTGQHISVPVLYTVFWS